MQRELHAMIIWGLNQEWFILSKWGTTHGDANSNRGSIRREIYSVVISVDRGKWGIKIKRKK